MEGVTIRDLLCSQVKVVGSNSRGFGLVLMITACSFLFSCAKSEKPKVEAPPSPIVQSNQLQAPANLPAPELSGVQQAVKRVFRDSVQIDTGRKPAFIAGDFNGDQSHDIVVVLKPVPEKLAELNEEFPNWILRDPFADTESRVPRLRVAANDALLAVIHGHGPNGWRDPEATQTFLLKNVVGSGMRAYEADEVANATEGKKRPRFRGDVIGEVLGGSSGYLYYAVATYAWYDPKTFKGEVQTGVVHNRPRPAAKQ